MTQGSASHSADSEPVLGLDGRLIAEAVRHYESARQDRLDDAPAVARAQAVTGNLERRIVARARALPIAQAIGEALGQLRGALRLSLGAGLLVAAISGALAALAALEGPAGQTVNFHWALLSLLGVETIVLLLWLGLLLLRPGAPEAPSFGLLLAALARRFARNLWRARDGKSNSPQAAALQASVALTGSGPLARWGLAAISHGIWLTFLAGALAMTLVLLSVKQVVFVWHTTILSESSYVPATEALAALPGLTGFPVPTRAEIAASRWPGPDSLPPVASQAWAGLLIGSLVVYGLLPRALLLVLCLLLGRRAAARLRLDLAQPYFVALKERLVPSVRHEGVVEKDSVGRQDAAGGQASEAATVPEIRYRGRAALIGLEVERPAVGWPPNPGPAAGWHDLGMVEGRQDRDRVLEALAGSDAGLLLIAVSLLNTPDRGLGAFLARLRAATTVPIVVLLSDRRRLRDRLPPQGAEQRLADWRALTARAGLPAGHAVLYDLDRPEPADCARIAAVLGVGTNGKAAP